MIDPKNVTNFNRTRVELEEFMLFCIVVAGKPAFQQANKLDMFLGKDVTRPFEHIRYLDNMGTLDSELRRVKMGQYNRIGTAFRGVANFITGHEYYSTLLRCYPVEVLQCIKGIGMKTARFFVMHSRPGQLYACLDTHILQWLGEKGYEVPKSTPQGKKYLELEKAFLDICQEMNILPADLDLKIWNERH